MPGGLEVEERHCAGKVQPAPCFRALFLRHALWMPLGCQCPPAVPPGHLVPPISANVMANVMTNLF